MRQGGRAPAANTARRLFFALWPDEAVRRAITHLASTLPVPCGARLTRPDRFHVTVVFLGDFDPLPDPMLVAIRSAADSVRARGFELSLDHVGSFAHARVGWVGPSRVPRGLADLHDVLDAALRSVGVPLKSSAPFVPHITLHRNIRTRLSATDVSPIEWTVRDFVLVASVPGSPDPYRIVGTWPLLSR